MTKIYLISDTHFNHTNIIKYCNRPFTTIEEMNNTIIENWNKIVKHNDTVYFLGDLCMGDPHQWLSNLNGNKILIRGNHDKPILKGTYNYKIIKYNNERFLLIHNPYYIDFKWDGWILHGHHHNNEMITFPHINKKYKTINVSVELINYTPIELNELLYKRNM